MSRFEVLGLQTEAATIFKVLIIDRQSLTASSLGAPEQEPQPLVVLAESRTADSFTSQVIRQEIANVVRADITEPRRFPTRVAALEYADSLLSAIPGRVLRDDLSGDLLDAFNRVNITIKLLEKREGI